MVQSPSFSAFILFSFFKFVCVKMQNKTFPLVIVWCLFKKIFNSTGKNGKIICNIQHQFRNVFTYLLYLYLTYICFMNYILYIGNVAACYYCDIYRSDRWFLLKAFILCVLYIQPIILHTQYFLYWVLYKHRIFLCVCLCVS